MTLTLIPNPPVWGHLFTLSGSGFSPNATYNVVTTWPLNPPHSSQTGVTADSSGNFVFIEYAYYRGDYTIVIYSVDHHGNKQKLVDQVQFTVS